MKQHFIIKDNRKHLLLFFAGWGMDEKPFLQLQPAACDWMICYDYRSLEFDVTLIQGYSDITLAGWSMGVWAASQIINRHPFLPVRQSIAVNGTLYPIHETKGITTVIFEGTLQGLDEHTLQKFQRRMCGSAAGYREFRATAPERPAGELKEELSAIREHYFSSPLPDFTWQKAIIGKEDRIFLPDNQLLAWKDKAGVIEQVEAAHYRKELFNDVIMQIK